MKTINSMNYKDIIAEYHSGTLSPCDTVEIVQFLLDTDLIEQYPELYELADYYILEGLCYQAVSYTHLTLPTTLQV